MKTTIRGTALAGALLLTLAACGSAPDDETPAATGDGGETSAAASDFKACMVSDSGGFEDKSFNQSGFEGLTAAGDELGIEIKTVESKSESDFTPNIESLLSEDCNLIIGVGFLLEDPIQAAAEANPDVEFALVDSSFSDADFNAVTLDNAKPILFDTAQAAYLAGYLAAGVSTTGTIGTFGGIQLPSVTIFMDGLSDGIDKYNEDNGTSVKLLGWDKAASTGLFTGDFEDQAKGQQTAQNLLDQGADIIMPVAGPVGLGAAAAIKSAANGSLFIGVDSDWVLTAPDYSAITLTSVMKEIGAAVKDTVAEAANGEFTSDPYVGTLENGGLGLAPFHDLEASVPAELSAKIDELKAGIIDGSITVESESSPK